jgi:N-methylhydantoinase B
LVLGDVLDGYVSIEGAREDYRVVIDEQKLTVDHEATERLRSAVGGRSTSDFND